MKLIIACFTVALACSVYAGDGCCKDKKDAKENKDKKAPTKAVTGSRLHNNSTLTVQTIDEKTLRFDGVTNPETALGRMPSVYVRGK